MPVPGKVEELGVLSGGGPINGCSSILLIISAIFFFYTKQSEKERKNDKIQNKGGYISQAKMEGILFKEIDCIVGQETNQVFFFFLVASLQSMEYQIGKYQGFYFKSSVCCGAVMIVG